MQVLIIMQGWNENKIADTRKRLIVKGRGGSWGTAGTWGRKERSGK